MHAMLVGLSGGGWQGHGLGGREEADDAGRHVAFSAAANNRSTLKGSRRRINMHERLAAKENQPVEQPVPVLRGRS